MDRHFQQWSKRNLSLLGKIQIYKTFGLSQFLYHLSVLEPSGDMWKVIEKRINKFLWNKNYYGNTAPARIKKVIVNAPIMMGGFGMLDIRQVTAALRLRRHFILLEQNVHLLHQLLNCLINSEDYLATKLELEIDEVAKANLTVLQTKRFKDFEVPEWQLEADLILQSSLLRTRLENIVRPRKLGSREFAHLRRLGLVTVHDVLVAQGTHFQKLINITRNELKKILTIMERSNYPNRNFTPN